MLFVPSGQKLIPGLNFFELLLLKVDMKSNEHNRVKKKKKKAKCKHGFSVQACVRHPQIKNYSHVFVYRPIPPYTDFKVRFL